jgi:hypothetical protein
MMLTRANTERGERPAHMWRASARQVTNYRNLARRSARLLHALMPKTDGHGTSRDFRKVETICVAQWMRSGCARGVSM